MSTRRSDGLFAARVLHVLAAVFWIGGVAMVTAVLLPAVRRLGTPEERVVFFEQVERGFAAQSRVTTLIVAASGSYLVYRLDWWERFSHLEYWWMHAMVAVWAIFTLILFVLEPLFPHRRLVERAPRAGFDLPADDAFPLGAADAEPDHGCGRGGRKPPIFAVFLVA